MKRSPVTDDLLREALRVDSVDVPHDLPGQVHDAIARAPAPGRGLRFPGSLRAVPASVGWLVILALLLAAMAMAIAVGTRRPNDLAVVAPSPTPARSMGASPSSTVPTAGVAIAEIPVEPDDVVSIEAFGSLWLANATTGEIARLDPATNTFVTRIDVGGGGNDVPLAANRESVLVGSPDRHLLEIDPDTNAIVRRIALDVEPYRVAATNTDAWVTEFEPGAVVHVDLLTGDVSDRRELAFAAGVASAPQGVFVAQRTGELTLFGAESLEPVAEQRILGAVMFLRLDGDSLFVYRNAGVNFSRLDPSAFPDAEEVIGPVGWGYALVDGVPWISGADRPVLVRLDRATLDVTGEAPIPNGAADTIAAAVGDLWVSGVDADGRPVVHRIRPSPGP